MPAPDTKAIRVLLVDDHRSILWGLEKLIASASPAMEVVGTATSASAALGLLDEARPDVIVLDLDLGGESGRDAIPLFIERCGAKVLVLTGVRDKAVQVSAMVAGAHGVVEKEASAETILAAIGRVHEGEMWIERAMVGRIFVELSRRSVAQKLDPEQQKIAGLTEREREIIAVSSADPGASAKTIAEKLRVSEHTLRNHLTSIYAKLGVSGRLGLFAYALEHGLNTRPAGQ